MIKRMKIRWTLLGAILLLFVQVAEAIVFSNARLSPRNKERPLRKETLYIVLHTTEGPSANSLNKLSANGECHYLVDTQGKIWRIIDTRRVAYHCGLSMWKGRKNIDTCSIGIEVTGYHNRPLTLAQYNALKELLKQLRFHYKIAPQNVLTHSMVAYGEPNKWQRHCHRGRKRCGMLFAQSNIRAKLGLTAKYGADPDVKARRLRVADEYLEAVLYKDARPIGNGYSSASYLETLRRTPPAELPLKPTAPSPQKPPTKPEAIKPAPKPAPTKKSPPKTVATPKATKPPAKPVAKGQPKKKSVAPQPSKPKAPAPKARRVPTPAQPTAPQQKPQHPAPKPTVRQSIPELDALPPPPPPPAPKFAD